MEADSASFPLQESAMTQKILQNRQAGAAAGPRPADAPSAPRPPVPPDQSPAESPDVAPPARRDPDRPERSPPDSLPNPMPDVDPQQTPGIDRLGPAAAIPRLRETRAPASRPRASGF
jgi:hypothetical protein